jgi:thiol-disulfide isomerase/thioredoxin
MTPQRWRLVAVAGVLAALEAVSLRSYLVRASPSSSSPVESPFAACTRLAAPIGISRSASGPAVTPTALSTEPPSSDHPTLRVQETRALPDMTLPCFNGGAPVRLAHLGRPAVINLWSSTCAPCRHELPEIQRFANAAHGQVDVVGVITADGRDSAAAAGSDFGVSFPSVFDPDRRLLIALGRDALPVTVFVTAQGTIAHVDMTGALTLPGVTALTQQFLGVSV